MSKFRKTKNAPKLEICGKTPVSPVYSGIKDVMRNISWQVKNGSALPKVVLECIEHYERFHNTRNSSNLFFSVTKEHEAKTTFVTNADRNGWIVSIGMLRLLATSILPLILKDRYTNAHRGDKRKQINKSMDWVKPDFKNMREWFKLLDTIWFVKESKCDIIEASAKAKVFENAHSSQRYGYRMRNNKFVLSNLFMSKRYEATSWYNTCRKCYYEDHNDSVWKQTKNNYSDLRLGGVSYDTILSEIAMSLD